MRLGSIDCGTNTVLLLVADVVKDQDPQRRPHLARVADFLEIPRLGQGLDKSGTLSEEAMARTLAALALQVERAQSLGVDRLFALGTESLRAAKNGETFLARATAHGVPIEVISGEEEARLSFRAVLGSPAIFQRISNGYRGDLAVLDIGGGSTELIVGSLLDSMPRGFASVKIGSVRMTERFLHGDPPPQDQLDSMIATIDNEIAAFPFSQIQTGQVELVAVAGTATTLAAMAISLLDWDPDKVEGFALPLSRLSELISELARTKVAQRRDLVGLDPRRADVILAGAVILERVARRLQVPHVLISDRGVRWGKLEAILDTLASSQQSSADTRP